MEIKITGFDSQFGHIDFGASRMRRNKIRNQLLTQIITLVDTVKHLLEPIKQVERRFAHHRKHRILSMLGRDFEPATYMVANQFLVIPAVYAVNTGIA